MTNPVLSNRVGSEQVILWQYDKAYNLIALIRRWMAFAKLTTEDFWDTIRDSFLAIDGQYVHSEWNPTMGYRIGDWVSKSGKTYCCISGIDYTTDGDENEWEDDKWVERELPAQEWKSNSGYEPGSFVTKDGLVFCCTAEIPAPTEGENTFDITQWSIDNSSLNSIGLDVWGFILGLRRPIINIGTSVEPNEKSISDDLYRRVLKGRYFLLGMSPTTKNYNEFLSIVFPMEDDGTHEEAKEKARKDGIVYSYRPKIHAIDGGTSMPDEDGRESISQAKFMTMTFSEFEKPDDETDSEKEERLLWEQHKDILVDYPAGIRYEGSFVNGEKVIGFAGQDLNNFADAFAWATDDDVNGGIFAGTDRANFPGGEYKGPEGD